MLTAFAAAPASAQTPLGLDGKASEQATTLVAQAVEPVSRVTEQVAAGAEPVSRVTEQVAAAAEPALDAAGRVAGGATPVLDAAAGVAAPAVRLGEATAPVRDVVDDITRPVGGALTGDRSSRPDRGSTLQTVATFGRPGSGGPSGSGGDGGSNRPAAGGLAAERTQAAAPGTPIGGVTLGPSPAAPGPVPGSARDQRVTTGAPDERPSPTTSGRADGAPAITTGHLSTLLSLPDLADAIAPPSPETSTSTSPTDGRPAQISPERQPTPAPSAPAGAAAAGAASAGSAASALALLALLLLAVPGLSLFLRTVPEFLRPAPFIVALERPG